MKSNFRLFFLYPSCLSLLFLWSGCDIINPEETLPTRIVLPPFQFQPSPGTGSSQQEIPEIWVYANSNFVGAFAPPVEVNYIGEGSTQLTFRPGIRNNGITQDPIIYPMFDGYTINADIMPGSRIEVQPVTRYRDKCFFTLLADFEGSNEFVDNRDTIAASALVRSQTDVFEGEYAGQITLSEEASFIEVGHSVPLVGLPTDGRACYLEFRYKSETEMSIGILGINTGGQSFSNFFYLVNPKDEWNQLYIELTPFLQQSNFPAYKILFRSRYPDNADQAEYQIFLDNIKVVHLTE